MDIELLVREKAEIRKSPAYHSEASALIGGTDITSQLLTQGCVFGVCLFLYGYLAVNAGPLLPGIKKKELTQVCVFSH